MIKLRRREQVFKGEITAFLTLVFVLMISIVGVLLQSASVQIGKTRMKAITQLALESTFAEYHKEALEAYDIFARFGCTEELMQQRLAYYGATDMSHTISKMELLTDDGGSPFYRQAIRYAKDWVGVTDKEDFHYDGEGMDMVAEESNVSQKLEGMLKDAEEELPTEDNPLESMKQLKELGILNLVVSNPEQLSNRNVEVEALSSKRTLSKGNYHTSQENDVLDKAFFLTYVTEHFSNKQSFKEAHTLLYEQEYLIGGEGSDIENLRVVCEKILLVRMAINYIYLQTSDVRKAEAEVLAASLCSLLTVPEITSVVKQALLLAWAYGESLVDVRVLLKGEKVVPTKSDDSWQLQLQNLVKLGTQEEVTEEKGVEKGLSYEDYLKALLILQSREQMSMRCLDLIESNLGIKADQCMTKVVVKSAGNPGLGVTYEFSTIYGYQ